jgi:hypothetical protein
MKNKRSISLVVVLLTIAALVMTGCFAQKQAGSVKFSGYMPDVYPLLQKGEKGQALYNYEKPGLNVASYTKILLEPVTILRPADAKGAVPEDDQKVANNFYSQLVAELSKNYEMVKEPAPNALRVEVALTDVSSGIGAVQTVTSILPIGLAIKLTQTMVGAKPSFSGQVSVEVKITDAASGELLGAAVDRRIAEQKIGDVVNTWDNLTNVTETWSQMFAYRLCTERGGTDCVKPGKKD